VSKVAARVGRSGLLRSSEDDELRRGIEDNLVTLGVSQIAAGVGSAAGCSWQG
jgi:hypothetical protein